MEMKDMKFRIGIIGAGGIARYAHIPGWKKLADAEVIAVADPSRQALKIAQDEFAVPFVYTDYRKMLERKDIDIIDICAPNSVHFPATIAALQSGRHVICEKPIAVSSKEVEEMHRTAKRCRKKLMAAQSHRFRPESEITKSLISKGVFGEIYFAQCHALRRRLLPINPTFIRKELSGGGPLLDIGVHILDLSYWFLGCPKVHSVSGVTFTKLARRKDVAGLWGEWDRDAYDVEDFAAGFVRFKDGRSLTLACSFLANMEKQEDFSVQLFGTEAGMHWPTFKLFMERNRILEDVELNIPQQETEPPHYKELRVFLECVKENKEVPVRVEESIEVIRMLEGIYRSAETNQEVVF